MAAAQLRCCVHCSRNVQFNFDLHVARCGNAEIVKRRKVIASVDHGHVVGAHSSSSDPPLVESSVRSSLVAVSSTLAGTDDTATPSTLAGTDDTATPSASGNSHEYVCA